MVVGGGFAGLAVVRGLAHAPVEATLVDRRNFHLFQPLLYQVATGGLSPADIAAPLRALLKRQRNARVLLAEARGLDPSRRRLLLSDGELPYDVLVLAAGSQHHYFGRPEWEALAPGLKTIEDATEIRRRVLAAFEAAERAQDPQTAQACLTFAVVGAGPTGVELAGALAEIAGQTLRGEFRHCEPERARIVLCEAGPRVLPTFPPDLSQRAQRALERLGVEVWTGTRALALDTAGLDLERQGRPERLAARVVLWSAGVQAAPLARVVADALGVECDRAGRLPVGPDLSVPGHPEVFALGDLACANDVHGRPLPGVAPVAMQQGRYAARAVAARLRGTSPPAPFRYRDKGSLATIGRAAAVADFGRLRLDGYPAWWAWLLVHLMYLVDFENRVLVLVQWAWSYFTRNRSARLITHGRWPA